MSDKIYCYPPTYTVLKNKLGIRTAEVLYRVERRFVTQRIREGVPRGQFDLAHLQAIHLHLFQDVYEWAGNTRTVELAKGSHQFQPRRYIGTGMADIHRRLVQSNFLQGVDAATFAHEAGTIVGDLNYVHPFRERNGRCQILYLKQLADQSGHSLDLTRLDPVCWIEASRSAHTGDYEPLASEIAKAL